MDKNSSNPYKEGCPTGKTRGKELGKMVSLPKITDPRGNLTVVENEKNIPFDIKRAYWVYDVPAGESRGGHAHKQLKQLLIPLSGSFTVTLDNGFEHKRYLLNHPYQGLLIDTMVWRTIDDFSSGAVCLALASELYDPDDYIYDYEEYLQLVRCSK